MRVRTRSPFSSTGPRLSAARLLGVLAATVAIFVAGLAMLPAGATYSPDGGYMYDAGARAADAAVTNSVDGARDAGDQGIAAVGGALAEVRLSAGFVAPNGLVDEFSVIKPGSAGGETAGKPFSTGARNAALEENPGTCVYCHMETETPHIDHVIPKSRGGNATLDNAQTTCPWCNLSKGARDFPVNPHPGYRGPFPPDWWGR